MAPGHELGAGVEHLVLGVAAGEFRADRIPGEAHELDAPLRVGRGRLLGASDVVGEHRVGEVPGGGRQHDEAAAGELADRVDEPRVEVLGQHLGGVHEVPVGDEVAVILPAARLHPVHESLHHRRLGREVPELLAHVRDVHGADGLRHLVGDPDQEPHLDHQPDLGLIVLEVVGVSVGELGPAEVRVAVDEDPLPGHVHFVKVDEGIVLVEMRRERIVILGGGSRLVRAARHDLDARVAHRDREGDRVLLLAGLQGLDIGDEHLVGHDRPGAEHLRPAHRDSGGVLVHYAAGEVLLALVAGVPGPVGLRVDDDVGEVEIVVARPREVVEQRLRARLPVRAKEMHAHHLPRHAGRDVVRRSPEPAAGERGPGGDRLAAVDEVPVVARKLPAPVDAPAARRRLEGHELAVLRRRLELVEPAGGRHRVAVGGVDGDVSHASAVEEDLAPVLEAQPMLSTVLRHFILPPERCRARRPPTPAGSPALLVATGNRRDREDDIAFATGGRKSSGGEGVCHWHFS